MELWLLSLILFGSLLLFMLAGVSVAFTMGGLSLIFGYFLWGGISGLQVIVMSSYNKVSEFIFVALPLYIFMAAILRYSKLTDGMYETFYRWFGGIRGGLAVGTIIISALYAAMVGVTTVATATLGMTARPSMINKGYHDNFTSGIIIAGSGLGILIPPSILMIIYAAMAGVSPGKLFVAGIMPGLMMAAIMIVYALVLCYFKPEIGPAVPEGERFTWAEKFESLKGVVLPLLIIIGVLLSIFLGIATPTEAAAVGCIGSLVAAAINKQLNFSNFKNMIKMTVGVVVSIFWLIIGASAYSQIVTFTNVGNELANWIAALNVNSLTIISAVLLLFFIMGMFLDLNAMIFVMLPVLIPILNNMDIDLIWFGVVFILMACLANMTPPFGLSLFVLKSVVPDLNMRKLYISIWPYVGLYIIGVILVLTFPDIILWLPEQMKQ